MTKLCKCGAFVERRCNKCYPQSHAMTTKERGYDQAWRNLRAAKLIDNPLCQWCERDQKATPATQVHHIYRIATHPQLRLDIGNLMAVCDRCHGVVESLEPSDVEAVVSGMKAGCVEDDERSHCTTTAGGVPPIGGGPKVSPSMATTYGIACVVDGWQMISGGEA